MVIGKWVLAFIIYLQTSYHLSDAVAGSMLRFFKVLFGILGRFSSLCGAVAKWFPGTLYKMKKIFGFKEDNFRHYVVCKKCHQIYFFQDCIVLSRAQQTSKLCPYQRFPNHPHKHMQRPCGTQLLKSVELKTGRHILYPFMTYCYLGLETSIQSFLLRPEFLSKCTEWRQRNAEDGVYMDVYDGQIWKEFQSYNEVPLLSDQFTFGLMINIDWFQPFKHTPYSVGAIYLTIMNLPRNIRFKRENVILVGLIPGPHEPSHNINSFLDPLVDELISFLDGVQLNVHGYVGKKNIRCVLLCAACDIPAGRKVCGFLSHSAKYGCSRGLKAFPGNVREGMDYSGFNRDLWPKRSLEAHKESVRKIQMCITKSDIGKVESETGYRYTAFLRLSYFNPTRMLIVDPMHNLFLGLAKFHLKVLLIGRNMISESELETLQHRVNHTIVPSDIGRIPHKIASSFASFTADQFKNWVIYFSPIALRGILVGDDFECWRHLVLACRILCRKKLNADQVQLANALLLQFCKRTERMYGKDIVTPNMHFSCHIRECVHDYGPLYGFWLFSFERYNGILGSIPNNNRSVELQFMNRFLRDSVLSSIPPPEEFKKEFTSVFSTAHQNVGAVLDTINPSTQPQAAVGINNQQKNWTIDCSQMHISLPSCCSRALFNASEIVGLTELYSRLHSTPPSSIQINAAFLKYSSASLNGKLFGSHKSRSSSSSIVLASWDPELFGISGPATSQDINRPLRINYFAKHNIVINGHVFSHLLMSASWFKYHPKKDIYGKPVSVWECDIYETPACYSIIPVQLIRYRTVTLIDKLDGASALFVCPCVDSII